MLGDSVRRRQPKRRAPRAGSDRPRGERNWRRLLGGLVIALIVPFLIGYLIAVYVLFPPTEVSGAGLPVPDLHGRTTSQAQRDIVAAGLGDMQITELPHPDADEGTIIAQSPLPGQQLRRGADIRIAVSSGPARVMMPDVLGFSAERAESMLVRAGFTVSRSEQESPAPAGRVIRTEPEPGQPQVLPATVTLIVSSGPPAVPDAGVFPDSAASDPPESSDDPRR
ncbi:MAG: PASTA domain-containing protein [Gemmatimonadetes bacterium]|nr:PASTA domain-containing protein [Gemmatimonadota bacterium]